MTRGCIKDIQHQQQRRTSYLEVEIVNSFDLVPPDLSESLSSGYQASGHLILEISYM